MTDTDKLKRLAEAWKNWGEKPYADAILTLIAENERLVEQYRTAMDRAEELGFAAEGLKQQRDEAVALLRSMDKVRMYDEQWAPVSAFLTRIDAA